MTSLTLKERWVFSIVLPMCALLVGYFLVLATTDGEGSSIGFRAISRIDCSPSCGSHNLCGQLPHCLSMEEISLIFFRDRNASTNFGRHS